MAASISRKRACLFPVSLEQEKFKRGTPMPQYNPDLVRRDEGHPHGSYEKYDTIDNVVQQTRSAPPGEFEMRLAQRLEAAFIAGATSLDGLVAYLNDNGLTAPDGQPWQEASLLAHLQQHGEPA
jgi:hypothetical protein